MCKQWHRLKLTFLPICMLHSRYKWKQKTVAADKKLQWVLQCLPLPRKITPDSSIYSTLLFHLITYTIHTIKPTNALMLKLNFLHTICHNCDMFQPILIIFREYININQAYAGRWMDYWFIRLT